MKKRQSTVEPVIGSLVNNNAMKRINTKGLVQANKCMTMAAVAYNIKKLLKFTTRKSQLNEMAKAKTVSEQILRNNFKKCYLTILDRLNTCKNQYRSVQCH